ncbi:MAG: hypothetical protein COC03_07735 [Robiginitomaculum sp.]|nr:MAG: hypothetical protein COC03_07735 [Robiginitomaculum sp.]
MNIQKPDERFDFSVAISQLFRTQDGKAFAKRLWFWASAAYAIAMLVTFPFIIKHYPDLLEANWHNMKAMMAGRAPDNAALFAILPKMLPSYLFLMASMLAIGAAVETALHKKVLLGEEEQRMPLRFGSVQLRVLIAQVAVWMIWFLVYTIGVLVLALFIGALATAVPILGAIIGVAGFIALMCLLLFLPIRLAPAAALSVNSNSLQIMGARKVSKGIFWNLLGAYLAVIISGYVFIYVVMSVGVIAVTGDAAFLEALSGMGEENPKLAFAAAAERFKNPLVMFIGIVAIFAYAGAYAIYTLSISGISSYTVKWWRGNDEASQFD